MFSIELNCKIKKISWSECQDLVFHLDRDTSNTLALSGVHELDCCEDVAFDFDEIPAPLLDALTGTFVRKVEISMPSSGGALLRFEPDSSLSSPSGPLSSNLWYPMIDILIGCHNIQNGYYSSDLALLVEIGGVKITSYIEVFTHEDIG